MSLFEKEELRSLLAETKKQLLETGKSEATAHRITRKEFKKWLEGYTSELKLTIASNATLPVSGRNERIKKQRKDFHYFRTTYFPHYYFLPGKSLLQAELESIYYRIAEKSSLSHPTPALASGVSAFSARSASTTVIGEKFALAAPRGHGKSTDVSVVFILWCVANNLKHFITLFSDAIELTETLIESIKAELEENENLKADFPHATGIGRIWKIGDMVTCNGIRVKGYGSGKRVRGVKHGVWRPDLTLIDDLENDENVRSRTQRDKLEKWLDEAVANLGSVDDTMDIIYIGTLLHRDSVLARKLKLAFWNPKTFRAVVQFPIHMDLWEEYGTIYRYQGLEAARAYYRANRPMMDEGAIVLWPEAVPIETLMRKRSESPRSFNKEQQNNPNAEAQKFKRENLHFYTQHPKKLRYYGWCDPAGNKKKSDYTNFTILGVSEEQRRAWVVESINKVIPSMMIVKTLVDLQELYHCKKFGYETNGGQGHLVSYIKKEAFERGVHMPLKEINNTESKEDRIDELEIPSESGEILYHQKQTILLDQLEDFPEGEHDDGPDGLSGAYRLTKLSKKRNKSSKRGRAPQPRQSIQYGRLP